MTQNTTTENTRENTENTLEHVQILLIENPDKKHEPLTNAIQHTQNTDHERPTALTKDTTEKLETIQNHQHNPDSPAYEQDKYFYKTTHYQHQHVILTTDDLTPENRDKATNYITNTTTNTPTSVHYFSNRSRTQLLKTILNDNTNLSLTDHATRTTLHTNTPENTRETILNEIREHYRTQRMIQRQRRWQGGRPPLGFNAENGELIETEEYDHIQNVLKNVYHGNTTQTDAAEELACARKTIRTAVNHPKRYRLTE